jgi:subtilase family serine protease
MTNTRNRNNNNNENNNRENNQDVNPSPPPLPTLEKVLAMQAQMLQAMQQTMVNMQSA